MRLSDLQRAMSAGILSGQPAPAVLAVVLGAGVTPGQRLQVHRNNHRIMLAETLAGTFPICTALVGREFFQAMVLRFVDAHPPRGPVIAEYGDALATFIEAFPPAAAVPYLADVARVEWAVNLAARGGDATPAQVRVLGALPPEQVAEARLHLHPTLQVVPCDHPAVSIWHAHQPDPANPTAVDLATGPQTALIHRRAAGVAVAAVSPAHGKFLTALADDAGVADAYEAATAADPDFALPDALADLFGRGLVVGFHVPPA